MTKKCFYCSEWLTGLDFDAGVAVKIVRDRYAHTDCIDSHGKENTMNDQTPHILGAADSAHQGIELAISLLQESMGNMGEILTQGCVVLGPASLGSVMRLGQKLKETRFALEVALIDARGLCILLGRELGVCEDKVVVLDPGPEHPSDMSRYRHDMLGDNLADMVGEPLGIPVLPDLLDTLASDDFGPGEDEFDDDEQPF